MKAQKGSTLTPVEMLVETIDAFAMQGGLDPKFHAVSIHESWTRAALVHWARLAVFNGLEPPTAEERAEVLARLRERAARGRAA